MQETVPAPYEAPRYDFHDPDFVAWWLRSLYMLPVDQQAAAAQSIRMSVNTPQVHAEIDVYLAEFGYGPLAQSVSAQPYSVATGAENASDLASRPWQETIAGSARTFWDERKPLVIVAVITLGTLAYRGVQSLASMLF